MNYKALQDKAKELGLPYVAVSRKKLEISIQKAEAKDREPPKPSTPEVDPSTPEDISGSDTPAPKERTPKAPTAKVKNANAAVVYDGKNEVRRYTLVIHGKGFEKLANEFTKDSSFRVELVEVKPSIECPSCGHKFEPA